MNAAAVWTMPLRSTSAGTRWTTVAMMVFMLALSVVLLRYQQSQEALWVPPFIAAYGELFAGAFLLAPGLLLAIDARQLRLPRAQHQIVFGMILHAAAWIAIPSLILITAGAEFARVIAMQAIGLVAGLTLGFLPQAFVIMAVIAPTFFSLMKLSLPYPKTVQAYGFWILIATLLFVCILCWRRQLRVDDPYRVSFGTPAVMRIRLISRGWGRWSAWYLPSENPEQIRSRPAWLQAIANLHGSGPQHPIRSLRIALGGWLMPKSWLSTLKQCALIVLPVPSFLAVLYVRFPGPIADIWRVLPFDAYAWFAGFASVLLSLMATMLVQQRWLRANEELSVLALLPGLGQGTSLIRSVLCASLLPTLCLQLAIAALLAFAAIVQPPSRLDLIMAMLAQLTALAFAPAFAVATISGRALPPWVAGLTVGVSFSLVGIGSGVSAAASNGAAHGLVTLRVLIAIWLILLAFLGWLGQRGWRSLWKRPHPFLAT
jgi:hypothetical protein